MLSSYTIPYIKIVMGNVSKFVIDLIPKFLN